MDRAAKAGLSLSEVTVYLSHFPPTEVYSIFKSYNKKNRQSTINSESAPLKRVKDFVRLSRPVNY